jgi:hypothetical protein
MAFAPGCYAEKVTECIVRHVFRPDRAEPIVTGRAILQKPDTHRPKFSDGKSLSLREPPLEGNAVSANCERSPL